jgi:hypothetical protein
VVFEVVPIAFDSMGVRSMCTLVRAGDHRIVVDPGACLAKTRFGLPATSPEMDALTEIAERIAEVAETADTIIVSHFHHDHYGPNSNFYTQKLVIVKHPKENINRSQKMVHAPFFINRLRSMTRQMEFGDGQKYKLTGCTIEMSPAVPHGTSRTRRGYVLMTNVRSKEGSFVHTSDVQGPTEEATLQWIIDRDPTILVVGGPRFYVAGKLKTHLLEDAEKGLRRLLDETRVKKLVLDHHAVRQLEYRSKLTSVWEDERVMTAAEYLGQDNNLLEARRQELWKDKFMEGSELVPTDPPADI